MKDAAPQPQTPPFGFIGKWAGFVKLSHTVFALPFALASMLVAAREQRGWPGWKKFGLILVAMVCARTCAMAFNRIVDREFDKANPRTAGRHLPTGQITLASASVLCAGSGAGLIVACYFLNPICFYFSFVALAIVCFYSLTKRFTDFTHVFLGMALALAPLGAWLAVKGGFSWSPMKDGVLLPILLAGAVVFWLVGFDIIYALQDYEFDRAHGLHSLVVRFGPDHALTAAMVAHMLMWGLLLAYGWFAQFHAVYFVGLCVILFSLFLEHWLARRRSVKLINVAFFQLNALISVLFLIMTLVEVAFVHAI